MQVEFAVNEMCEQWSDKRWNEMKLKIWGENIDWEVLIN